MPRGAATRCGGKDRGMKGVDAVKEFVKALESRDLEKAAGYLSVDFEFSGLTPLPIGREGYLDVQRGILSAFRDWRFNLSDVHERAGTIEATAHITGTQTGDLVVPVPDLPAVPATGKHVSLPGETHFYRVRGSKIASLRVVVTPGGGFQGLYGQLGARLPSPSAITG